MSRRDFIEVAGAGALLGMTSTAAPAAQITLKDLSRSLALEERIRRIQTFVHERYYDPQGILYSHINFENERPHTEAELKDADPNNLGIPQHDLENYENSAMNSGIFLAGQCYRYLATKDAEALALAARAFRSIDLNYSLAEQAADQPGIVMQRAGSVDPNDRWSARAGWICKPYGGALTTQTSTEQNFGPIWGLYVYREIAPE
jgi:hypothetical protein